MPYHIAKLWADMLEKGEVDSFNKVPIKLKAEVLEILNGYGYKVLDDGSVVEIE